MNESFGELSRPMRNRGIEIYMNDFELSADLEDMLIILNTLYPFNNSKSDMETVFCKIVEANIKHIHFSDILKMFKLTYDYWLFSSGRLAASKLGKEEGQTAATNVILDSFDKMIADIKIKYGVEKVEKRVDQSNSLVARISERNYHSEILKLKEYKIYRFLFNFPLYSQFMQNVNRLFVFYFNENDTNVANYSKSFLEIVQRTQFIDIWLRNVPIEYSSLIFKFTRGNLELSRPSGGGALSRERLGKFFDIITKQLFNKQYNMLYRNFSQNVDELAKNSGMDLGEESLSSMRINEYLLQRLDSSSAAYESALKNSSLLHVVIRFYVSKFRIESFYSIENNQSLVSIIEKIDSNLVINKASGGSEAAQIVSLKFLKQLRPFYESFFASLINYFYLNSKPMECFDQEIVMRTVYLIEKFYLICAACSYDSVLTLSYMKYYWSFIENGLKEIEKSLIK
jgi:hypothetical protein